MLIISHGSRELVHWDVAAHQVRWMTSWDTTADDVERFAAGVAAAVDQLDPTG